MRDPVARPRAAARSPRHPITRRLLVFGRHPEPGRTKTRLIPALGPEGASELYRAFLDDLLAWAPDLAPTELWVPRRPQARAALEARYPGIRVHFQPEGDLGVRLAVAFAAAFDDGADHVVVVGSDHPTLPRSCLEGAFAALPSVHLVLGPTRDGGYYAVGLRRSCWPRAGRLFEEAPWSTRGLLDWTRRRAEALDLRHLELPCWYDVDEPRDLGRLGRDLVAGSATERVWRRVVDGAGADIVTDGLRP